MQDRYIKFSDGGDQFCGRVASGLNFNDGSKFAVLPPHFGPGPLLTIAEWSAIAPGYGNYSTGFKSCLPMLLASLIHHHPWWSARNEAGVLINISHRHPIWNSRVQTLGIIERLKDSVIANITSGRCEVTGMTATGIPPQIDLQRQVELLRIENGRLREALNNNQLEVLEVMRNELPNAVSENIMRNVNVQGVQQMSVTQLEGLLQRMIDNSHAGYVAQVQTAVPIHEAVNSNIDETGYKYWVWGGMFRPVPQDWSMANGKVKTILDLFITGLPLQQIRPFNKIQCKTLARKDQCTFSKAEGVYKKLITISQLTHYDDTINYNTLSLQQWDGIFESSYNWLIAQVNRRRLRRVKRAGELSVSTVYDMINEVSKQELEVNLP